jgi:uncharacterized protein YjbK
MKQITVKHEKQKDCVVITIPVEVLCQAAKDNLDKPLWIIDENKFVKKVVSEIENYATVDDADNGRTHFQQFLDDMIVQVAESKDDCIIKNAE